MWRRTMCFSDPNEWNSLPSEIRSIQINGNFEEHLKFQQLDLYKEYQLFVNCYFANIMQLFYFVKNISIIYLVFLTMHQFI